MRHRHPPTDLPYDPRHAGHARRITWIGLGVNLLLTGLKFVCGVIGSSQALIADAVHTLSDSGTDVAVLVGIRYWTAPADEGHPHGHRRIETVITVVIAVVLAGVAAGLVANAVTTLRNEHAAGPGWIALAAASISIASKEAVYRWTIAVGKRIKSAALIANAWHHRSDALSSIPVVLAIAGAKIEPAFSFLDRVGAIVVSVFILRAVWQIGWPALQQLVDTAAPEKERQQIADVTLTIEDVKSVHAVRTRYIGSGLQVDLHIGVDGDLTVRKGHDISEVVKQRLLAEGPDVVDVVVHLEPDEKGEKEDE